MTKAFLYCGQLRVYNRPNGYDHEAFTTNEKKLLKNLGFIWDRYNKSYLLNNPSENVINELSRHITIQINAG